MIRRRPPAGSCRLAAHHRKRIVRMWGDMPDPPDKHHPVAVELRRYCFDLGELYDDRDGTGRYYRLFLVEVAFYRNEGIGEALAALVNPKEPEPA